MFKLIAKASALATAFLVIVTGLALSLVVHFMSVVK